MRKVLVTFVLALAVTMTQVHAQQPANPQANTPTSQKVIKDPAEYNAYMTAWNTTDPAAKGQAMEAFAAQYPNSIVKIEALEQARAAYQQANNSQKVEQIARQVLQVDPNNVQSLAIVVFLERNQVTDAASGGKARADAERGLQELPNWKKPEGITDADYEKMKIQMGAIFAGTAAFGALQQQDYPAAQKYYEQALKIDPTDLANNYQMALSFLQVNPINPLGFWYGAKALSIAQAQNPQASKQWLPYFLSKYKKYHGNTDDWNQRIATAGTQTAPPADFVASIPLAPTPCDLAAQAVQQNDTATLSFSDYEAVLSCRDKTSANKDAAEKVWQAIQNKQKDSKGEPVKMRMNGVKVISATADSIEAAMTEDNQKENKADLHVVLDKPMAKPPAAGTMTDVIGTISAYTPSPFMFTMTGGELPAVKPPVHKPPVKKSGATKKKK